MLYFYSMIIPQYPDHPFRMKQVEGKRLIFDELRKTWLLLTPEEWVRQNFLVYLLQVRSYPASLIALEKKIRLGELVKRFDILVYDREHRPWMMVECKSTKVALSASVMEQLLRYNIAVPVPYLVITNGTYCRAFEKEAGGIKELSELPEFV